EQLNQAEAKYRKKLNNLDKTVKNQLFATTLLNIISSQLPDGVWLDDLSFSKSSDSQSLELSGNTTNDFDSVNRFATNLMDDPKFSKYFSEVNINSMERSQIENVSVVRFSISCKSKG
ncbi:MAG: PilN domain-containing protein, partial [Candidatus Omnitrophota bacterium]